MESLDIEKIVIGALISHNTDDLDISILNDQCFTDLRHRKLYGIITSMRHNNEYVDLVTLCKRVKELNLLDDVGGYSYIASIAGMVVTTLGVDAYCKILYEGYMRRQLINIGYELKDRASNTANDVFLIQETYKSELDKLVEFESDNFFIGINDAVDEQMKYNELLKSGKGLTGVTTGFKELDKITGGWQPSDLIILAARPGMGKTSLAIKYAIEACKSGVGVAFFSMEMSRNQIFRKLASIETGILLDKFIRSGLSTDEVGLFQEWAKNDFNSLLTIDDTAGISVHQMRQKCRRLKANGKLGLIVVDYLQLHTLKDRNKNYNRENEISNISRELKKTAKELNVPILALSQLSRNVENRSDKRPNLGDLRESGAIEQDADMVQFIYRPEYYDIFEDANGNPTKGMAVLDIAKHRNGVLTEVLMGWQGDLTKFYDLEKKVSGFQPNIDF